jgi:PIN domain nuclease of toxin-antitoxin system
MTGYLFDTGVFLLSMTSPERLNAKAKRIVEQRDKPLLLSAVSSWEISIKWRLGKLKLPDPPSTYVPQRLTQHGIGSLTISHLHALLAGELPRHHEDPFDRMLIAQATTEKLIVLTTDRSFERYDINIVWCGR